MSRNIIVNIGSTLFIVLMNIFFLKIPVVHLLLVILIYESVFVGVYMLFYKYKQSLLNEFTLYVSPLLVSSFLFVLDATIISRTTDYRAFGFGSALLCSCGMGYVQMRRRKEPENSDKKL